MDFFDPHRYFQKLDARRTEVADAVPSFEKADSDVADRAPPADETAPAVAAPAIAAMARVLRQAREGLGLSQRELGRRAGVPQSHVSKIESGQVDLRLSSLVALARVLDLEVRLVAARPAVERDDPFDVQPLRGRGRGE